MATEDSRRGDEAGGPTTTSTPANSAPGSPRSNYSNKNKVKFLCSHGGKILPKGTDGHLRYVGGETRAVSVPRDISFSELTKKLASMSDGDTVLKYQVMPEDLDSLVSVKTDEDLRHMIDEHDRHESTGTPKLRTFLFSASPIIVKNHTAPTDPLTRYIDAVNGIVRSGTVRATTTGLKLPQNPRTPSPLRVSSACSSPRSPDSCIDFRITNQEIINGHHLDHGMPKVHSSPSISSLNQHPPQPSQHKHHYLHHLSHHYNPSHYQLRRLGHTSPTGPQPDRLYSLRSGGRSDFHKYQAISSTNNYYLVTGYNRGSTGSS